MILFSTLSQGNILLLFTYLGFLSGCVFFLFLKLSFLVSTKKIYSSTSKLKNKSVARHHEKKEKPLKEKSYLELIIERQKREKKEKKRQLKLDEKNRKQQMRLDKNKKHRKQVVKDKKEAKKKKNKPLSEKDILRQKQREEKKKKRKEKLLAIRKRAVMRIKKVLLTLYKWFRNALSTIISTTAFACVLIFSMMCNIKLNYGRFNLVSIIVYALAFMLSKLFLKILANMISSVYNKFRLKGKSR